MSTRNLLKAAANFAAKKNIEEPGSITGIAIPKQYIYQEQLRIDQLRASMLSFFRNWQDKKLELPTPDEIAQMLGICRDDFDTVYQSLLNSRHIELIDGNLLVR